VAGEFPDLPMIAYNVPSRTAIDIAPAKALAETGRGDARGPVAKVAV
jgi:dihydrodipicolinate synthase/N-acetylneuraminate lyase